MSTVWRVGQMLSRPIAVVAFDQFTAHDEDFFAVLAVAIHIRPFRAGRDINDPSTRAGIGRQIATRAARALPARPRDIGGALIAPMLDRKAAFGPLLSWRGTALSR